MEASKPIPRNLILFDGVCSLCDASIQFILMRDSKGSFHFASQQEEPGRTILAQRGIAVSDPPDSVIFIQDEKIYFASDAVLRIARRLDFPWNLLVVFRVIPGPIRDLVYRWVARNRYRWFGKEEACLLPKPEWKSRFL